jgi:RNA polymerase sigma-70 factor (ECF subfamily)
MNSMASPDELIAAAQRGDRSGFDRAVAPYRREIVGHCYRMTGSLADAEDASQDALIRAWQALPAFEGRSSLRTWLHSIAARSSLDVLARRPVRSLPSDPEDRGDPAAWPREPVEDDRWLEPAPEAMWSEGPMGPEARYSERESVALAFLVTLQSLTPIQRASVILKDVLGWSSAEVALTLETTTGSVNSALQRARAALESSRGDWADPKAEALEAHASVLQRYVLLWERGEFDALVEILREDSTLTMPPIPTWFEGAKPISQYLGRMTPMLGERRMAPIRVAGGMGAAMYVRSDGSAAFTAHSLHALTMASGRIGRIDIFMKPSLFPRFGLADELADRPR